MRKIVIKNFGPIRDVAIELRPITVLIGEQATGKSTVAQCVHLFLSLGEDLKIDLDGKRGSRRQFEEDVLNVVRSKFYAYYGSSRYLENFEVKFYFDIDEDKFIHIRPVEGKTKADFSDAFDLGNFCEDLETLGKDRHRNNAQRYQELERLVSEFLGVEQHFAPQYVIAGRNITTAFGPVFNAYFQQNFRQTTRLGGRNVAKSAQMELTRDFINFSAENVQVLTGFRGNFEDLFEEYQIPMSFTKDFMKRSQSILKGKYVISSEGGEMIKIPSGKYIPLHFASSGQQESIRIILDLTIRCALAERTLRTIEEPEAHLFPSAQNELTELLVMTQRKTDANFFLTTHSPYFLASFNNLLYAAKAAGDNFPADKQPNAERIRQVEELGYPPYLRLLSNDFAVFQLKNGTTESIYDSESAIIELDGLDAVSLDIAAKFESLAEMVREEEYENA